MKIGSKIKQIGLKTKKKLKKILKNIRKIKIYAINSEWKKDKNIKNFNNIGQLFCVTFKVKTVKITLKFKPHLDKLSWIPLPLPRFDPKQT